MRNVTRNFKASVKSLILFSLSVAMMLSFAGCKKNTNIKNDPTEGKTEATLPLDATYDIPVKEQMDELHIGEDLVITDIGKYTGIYMEDGSNEVVTNIMMIILRNDNDHDLQLARIEITYPDFVAEYEVTNLAAGERIVLLEKNRHEATDVAFVYASIKNVAFFPESMSLCEDRIRIEGSKGSIKVENLTDEPFGDVYVYYKNSAVDLLYGGITYRARVEAGLEPGESTSVLTGHYNPDTCTIVNVQIQQLTPET